MVQPNKMWILRLSLCIVRTMHLIKPQHVCLVILSQLPEKMDEMHIMFIQQTNIYKHEVETNRDFISLEEKEKIK